MKQADKLKVTKNWHQYRVPGGSKVNRRKRNAIFINVKSTFKHELAKCVGALMVARFGDLKFNDTIVESICIIDKELNSLGMIKDEDQFITEAVPCSESDRRVDLVSLKRNVRYEFETNHKVYKKDAVRILI